MDKPRPHDEASDAVRLAMAVFRLRSRIRIEAGLRSTGIPISQLAVLGRIIDEGPTTAAALAASEHVTQQAIAQSLATLKQRGLVQKQADLQSELEELKARKESTPADQYEVELEKLLVELARVSIQIRAKS